MIAGISHINLSVSDIERSFRFYKELLGLKPLYKWPKGAYLLAGRDWICLSLCEALPTSFNNGYTHYAFSLNSEEFDQLRNKLLSAGINPFKENQSEGNSFYFLDPDGHQLELHVGNYETRLKEKVNNPWPGAEFYF